MHPFAQYLQEHNLDALTVALEAHVRYLTVWNATHGNSISAENARKIQRTVMLLTRHPYIGPLALLPEEQPTIPFLFLHQRSL